MYNNRLPWIILIIVVIAGAIGWYLSTNGLLPMGQRSTNDDGRASTWEAVFLSNGQVYFGKLSSSTRGQFVTLRDIYYLQLAQAPQPEKQTDQQPQISLVKLGEELHGPVDEMRINRDHILFMETMKDNAKVVEAIERYKKEGPTPPQTQQPSSTASPANTSR